MFPSPKRVPPPTIRLFRGNNARITFTDLKYNGEDKTTIAYGESILFIVKSPIGTTVLSKTLTGIEGEEIPIQFDLVPEDTVDLCSPFKYRFSVDLYKTESQQTAFFTLLKGDFILREPIGTIYDIETPKEGE